MVRVVAGISTYLEKKKKAEMVYGCGFKLHGATGKGYLLLLIYKTNKL